MFILVATLLNIEAITMSISIIHSNIFFLVKEERKQTKTKQGREKQTKKRENNNYE
jgi:hypothetical protein